MTSELHSTKFDLDKGIPSKATDIYVLGIVVYQMLTGRWTFFPRREARVMHAMISGERPPKLDDAECWDDGGYGWRVLEGG
jgi:serine/threonine protein kinase